MQRGPKEKKERALGERLQVKGARCQSAKCAAVRKPYRPGAHGQSRKRKTMSDFGRHLKEKQKFKVVYGMNETNLGHLVARAAHEKGATGIRVLEALESRLDNVVFRLGLAPSRSAARQFVVQGHIMVNAKKVRSPGYVVAVGDMVSVRPESAARGPFRAAKEAAATVTLPAWLHFDATKLEGKIIAKPEAADVPFEVNLLVESFSK